MIPAVVSALHVLGIAVSFGSLFARQRALGQRDLAATLYADNFWGLSALLVIGTGLARAFGGLEKGTTFYLENPVFHLKLGLLGLVLLLELWPMASLVALRARQARGEDIVPPRWDLFRGLSLAQFSLLFGMLFSASFMARGIGM